MAAFLALNGVDVGRYLQSTDPAECLALTAVADQVAEWRLSEAEAHRKSLANETGGKVGNVVGQALQNLARAFRG